MKTLLMEIYKILYEGYGPQHWWPGETPFEIMVGAVLTQNTSWRNVEKAIASLKMNDALDFEAIRQMGKSRLASLIRPSGTFRIKADRLKTFVRFMSENYKGDIGRMMAEDTATLRRDLLRVRGIGPETADSILLYGLKKPVFVVDAYTKRIFSTHGIISEKARYDEVQTLFMESLPHEEKLFNEYHALLVKLAKTLCNRYSKCDICPLNSMAHRAWRKAQRMEKARMGPSEEARLPGLKGGE